MKYDIGIILCIILNIIFFEYLFKNVLWSCWKIVVKLILGKILIICGFVIMFLIRIV